MLLFISNNHMRRWSISRENKLQEIGGGRQPSTFWLGENIVVTTLL